MQNQTNQHPYHSNLVGVIWSIANGLRGAYRPPQYRRVMLPLIVLARFDAILSQHTDAMKSYYEQEMVKPERPKEPADVDASVDYRSPQILIDSKLSKIVGKDRTQTLYNVSGYNLQRLLADPEQIAPNLIKYIHGFSPKARDIFDKFEFENEITKLDEANRLYKIIQTFVTELKSHGLDLSPDVISNTQMGYIFEELIRKFNEQANEEAGDHFTPREVIQLMVNLNFAQEQADWTKAGAHYSIYDPTVGTGGMLSESEKHLKKFNAEIDLDLYGQEYNPESYAICCADLLIKDEPVDNIIFGDTLGIQNAKDKGNGFVPHDGLSDSEFDYMFANPPFGVEWKNQEDFVKNEAKSGFSGRFGAGLPRINDGSLLFLQTMISKMRDPDEADNKGRGSRIAVVFNGSPLFTGDAGSGESNIRRWIIENDWLEAVIALPDQMFYNTGIYTYIWLVSNQKAENRKGKVQLIDATSHYQKMAKSLGNKRNELSEAHIEDITKLYSNFKDNDVSEVVTTKTGEPKVCSKIFSNQEFGYLKIVVERPLRLNFQVSAERIAKLDEQSAFVNLAVSKKHKDAQKIADDEATGRSQQQAIKDALAKMDGNTLYKDRTEFLKVFNPVMKGLSFTLPAPIRKAILEALSERDPTAEICTDSKGNAEPDTQLRDSELVPLPSDIQLPLPVGFDNETGLVELLELVKPHIGEYMQAEVLPHVADAWVDFDKTKVGYEIPINRHFYVYEPPRPLEVIKGEIDELEGQIMAMLKGLSA